MTAPTPAQLHHLANRARDGVALPAEHDQLAAGISIMGAQLAELDGAAGVAVSAVRLMNEAGARADRAEAAIERVRLLHDSLAREDMLASPDDLITRGRAAEHIAAALDGWTAPALDQAQQPTTTEAAPTCICGDPIQLRDAIDPSSWIHSPGSDTPCFNARPQQQPTA